MRALALAAASIAVVGMISIAPGHAQMGPGGGGPGMGPA